MVDNKFESMAAKKLKKVIDKEEQSQQTFVEINKPKIITQHRIKTKFFKEKQSIKILRCKTSLHK